MSPPILLSIVNKIATLDMLYIILFIVFLSVYNCMAIQLGCCCQYCLELHKQVGGLLLSEFLFGE